MSNVRTIVRKIINADTSFGNLPIIEIENNSGEVLYVFISREQYHIFQLGQKIAASIEVTEVKQMGADGTFRMLLDYILLQHE